MPSLSFLSPLFLIFALIFSPYAYGQADEFPCNYLDQTARKALRLTEAAEFKIIKEASPASLIRCDIARSKNNLAALMIMAQSENPLPLLSEIGYFCLGKTDEYTFTHTTVCALKTPAGLALISLFEDGFNEPRYSKILRSQVERISHQFETQAGIDQAAQEDAHKSLPPP